MNGSRTSQWRGAARTASEGVRSRAGMPERNRLVMQIFAAITGREFAVAALYPAPALGSAMFRTVAAGAAAAATTRRSRPRGHGTTWRVRYRPMREHHTAYDEVYQEYLRFHDSFGRGGDDVMRRARDPCVAKVLA